MHKFTLKSGIVFIKIVRCKISLSSRIISNFKFYLFSWDFHHQLQSKAQVLQLSWSFAKLLFPMRFFLFSNLKPIVGVFDLRRCNLNNVSKFLRQLCVIHLSMLFLYLNISSLVRFLGFLFQIEGFILPFCEHLNFQSTS